MSQSQSAVVVRSFQRALSSLPEIFRFIDEVLVQHRPSPEALGDIRLAVDELFTNMVRHQPGGGRQVEIALEHRDRRIIIRMVDHEVDRFDLTSAADPDIDAPAEKRSEGGLGIYLARQLMGALHYDYDRQRRISTLTMEKVLEA